MSIKYKVGCLIEAAKNEEVDVIAHQCNCFNTMGNGIAPLIAQAFPEAYEADQATESGNVGKLGSYSVGYSEDYILDIFNLYGQYGFNRTGLDTDYEALRSALRGMTQSESFLEWGNPYLPTQFRGVKIGLPKIGAGLGGGDWGIISQIIEEELGEHDVTIYVLDERELPDSCQQKKEIP